MKTSAVVVTYNRLSLLKECVNGLKQQTDPLAHIIIINNASTDDTAVYLKELKKNDNKNQFIIYNSSKNLGGAAGFNQGMKVFVEKTDDDCVWIMDDDTIPHRTSHSALSSAADALDNKFGFLCSDVRWTNGAPVNTPKVAPEWHKQIDKNLVKVEQATFVSVLISRKNIFKYGYPISEFVIWGDDTEYTTRLSREEECYFVNDSVVTHKTATYLAGTTFANDDPNRISRYEYMYRNLMYIAKKYYTRKKVALQFSIGMYAGINVFLKAKTFRMKRLNAAILGSIKGIFFNPKIEFPVKRTK
ncbi:glycosyltransferase family 2 protein [Lactiplantibacillus daoliensis]|uniref:Glycosyltransferase family 2 protein n=1 Tax=Lactiplantibacillus daoliensis TaxID=2559916 RepID=A0ABW1UDB0_9LACO|nr:glycosyltransferase family 2 protein [Lactiplantibacillus daoliensis]